MPRYFFHLHDGNDVLDQDGVELEDPDHARREAIVAAGSLLRDEHQFRWDASPWVLHVVDQHGRTVCRLKLSGTLA